ncbi:hypothetical protein [Thermococcus sp.]
MLLEDAQWIHHGSQHHRVSKPPELGLTVITPTIEDYLSGIRISKAMVRKGTPVTAVDAIVAAVAINRELKPVTRTSTSSE